MILSFHPCLEADAQVIPGDRKIGFTDVALIKAAEAILLPQSCPPGLYRACTRSAALLFPEYGWRFQFPGKTGQSRFFEKMGWPHPPTRRWRSTRARKAGKEKMPHRVPFFVKADKSHEGAGVWLVNGPSELQYALDRLEDWGGGPFLTQERVPCGGNVLRVVVLGNRVSSYWKRLHNRPITTVSRGATINGGWRSDLREKGIRRTAELCEASGINLAAMDFVFTMTDPEPEPLILEINSSDHFMACLLP